MKNTDKVTLTIGQLKRLMEASKTTMYYAVCVFGPDDNPFIDHDYSIGYFSSYDDALDACEKDANRYINQLGLLKNMIEKSYNLSEYCIISVETRNDENNRYWQIRKVPLNI